MKVKNLIFGDIAKIEYARMPGEDYYPSSFDEEGNLPMYKGESLFYKIGNHAFDLIGFGFYKIVKYQDNYPDKLRGKKEQEEKWRGWGESVCFKGRERQGASNGDRVFRVIGQRGC